MNKSIEEQIASMKAELKVTERNISRLKKDLETNEYYKSAAGAADYERVSDSIAAMQDVAEEMRNELREKIKNHERMIKDVSDSSNARGKESGKKETLGSERASKTTASRKPETRRRRAKSR